MGSESLETNSETVIFRDGTDQWQAAIPGVTDATRNSGTSGDVPLSAFFARPLQIASFSWSVSATPFFQEFNPWTLFFEHPRVANRITNYHQLQSKLCVKIMISGNPFYYGRLMAEYQPLHLADTVTSTNGLERANLVTASQRLHLYLDPTTSQAGSLHLPFLYPDNAVEIPLKAWSELGLMRLRELNGLKHANASVDPVEITVFAWAEDITLSNPTTLDMIGLVPQSDEYSSGPISNIATAVAAAAGKLSNIPYIGSYAKATHMVASGMGVVAKAFGFSRPVLIDDPKPMFPVFIGRMCNTDNGDNTVKLSVDSKQELTIDTAISGVHTSDELVITEIAAKESFLTSFAWPTLASNGAPLWNVRVHPQVVYTEVGYHHMPACAFASLPFKYWRGTMRYRFQIVASAYHKGRLRIVFDPNYIVDYSSNVAYTRIIDIANERDFTIDVAWAQPTSYLPLTNFGPNGQTTPYSITSSTANGVLGVYVQNDLTSPNSEIDNNISVNVFVSMCDDAQFAVPVDNISELSYSPQSSDYDDAVLDVNNAPTIDTSKDTINSCLKVDHTDDVYFGERIVSFRQLLRRYNYHSSYGAPIASPGTYIIVNRNFPEFRGNYSTGNHVKGLVPANLCPLTLLNYIVPAFVGVRGAMRSKYALNFLNGPIGLSTISNNIGVDFAPHSEAILANAVAGSPSDFQIGRSGFLDNFQEGGDMIDNTEVALLSAEFPDYNSHRFHSAKDLDGISADYSLGAKTHKLNIMRNNGATSVDRYISVGEDFQVFLFQGAPPIRVFTSV